MKRLGADIKGPKLLVNRLSVAFPVQSAVQVKSQVFVIFNHLFSKDKDGVWLILGPPKNQNNLVLFVFKVR